MSYVLYPIYHIPSVVLFSLFCFIYFPIVWNLLLSSHPSPSFLPSFLNYYYLYFHSSNQRGSDDEQISTAFGYIVHVLLLISKYFGVSLSLFIYYSFIYRITSSFICSFIYIHTYLILSLSLSLSLW